MIDRFMRVVICLWIVCLAALWVVCHFASTEISEQAKEEQEVNRNFGKDTKKRRVESR
jgi:hypothetical protein